MGYRPARVRILRFEHLHRPDGWLSPGYVAVDADGFIQSVGPDAPGEDVPHESFAGFAIPGVPNVHGHAFQRVFAGHTERTQLTHGEGDGDSFWTWRAAMYRVASALDPDDIEAIAALVQMEMLEAGFTTLGEFHYLHHAPDGTPYDDRAETSRRILAAAATTGMAVTLLPVAYLHAGFGRPLSAAQRRFGSRDVDAFLDLWGAARDVVAGAGSRHRIGVAPHSLRAVAPNELAEIVAAVHATQAAATVHIHVAEQRGEVEQCVEALGATPVAWLCENLSVDRRWCLVHATHADEGEIKAMARSGAVVGLCPTTEANLGDGVFPLTALLAAGGRIAIGTDSHASVDVAEELRWLEYGQRLRDQRRNCSGEAGHAVRRHVGRRLLDAVLAGGARALDQPVGAIEVGRRCDVVVLDPDHARLTGHGPATAIDAFVFSNSGRSPVRYVLVGGETKVVDGRHVARHAIAADFAGVANRLQAVTP